jgi:hypothetical protein
MVSGTAFSYTTWNLPIQGSYENPVDKVMVFQHNDMIADVLIAKSNDKSIPNMEDTIVIDLNEVIITESFPQHSHACLKQHVKYPDFALKEKLEGVVAVTLHFNSDGNVEILDSFSSDKRLESYVHGKLYELHMHVKNCSVKMYKPYNARFSFRLL